MDNDKLKDLDFGTTKFTVGSPKVVCQNQSLLLIEEEGVKARGSHLIISVHYVDGWELNSFVAAILCMAV